jgi:hypothetical protein
LSNIENAMTGVINERNQFQEDGRMSANPEKPSLWQPHRWANTYWLAEAARLRPI